MTLGDLIAIMAVLRDPERGCPWDKQQNFSTIAPYTIEEAYEVADAIARGDLIDLKDELGDLLLQVVYHAQMAKEDSRFDFDAVADGIARKMIRRHPHVFGDEETREAVRVPGLWDRIKAQEAEAKRAAAGGEAPAPEGVLEGIPLNLPALTRSVKIQRRAAKVGFDWPETEQIFAKVWEELSEFYEELRGGRQAEMQEEFGDLMFVLANLARRLDIDPEAALHSANRKFARRFAHIEAALKAQGRAPEQATLEEMEALWLEAKRVEKG
ncbi:MULTISPECIES: nucleoside triphosphate pyrophosphohydrolase [Rhodomicrobium]|uniref:nucleoside triphosphate pyrophosphohydrolase n=1 Tax=Rhodomicrobium TaxID=1068 RepID=UPI000B4B1AFC|nr:MULTISPECIES: nucleoside triphosphate pyrophosphohydrolase [Rhodomicrobium]